MQGRDDRRVAYATEKAYKLLGRGMAFRDAYKDVAKEYKK